MTHRFPTFILMLLAALMLGACGTDPGLLRQQSQASLNDFTRADPSLSPLLKSSFAYVIFPRITSGALVIGGAHGDGEVYKGGSYVGTADLQQGSVGLQAGGQSFSELIMFRTESTYLDFTHNAWEVDARASAIAASSGAAAAADYSKGVLVFTQQQGGLMAQAALGLQHFSYHPAANP